MYIRSVSLTRLRCFEEATLRFRFPTDADDDPTLLPNVTLLLGNNGAGKTTALRAVALAILGPVLAGSGFVPYSLVRRGPGRAAAARAATVEGDVVLHWQDVGDRKPSARTAPLRMGTTIERIRDVERVRPDGGHAALAEGMFDEGSPAFLLVGYGATRRVETPDSFARSSASLRKARLTRYQRVAGLFEEHVTLTPLSAWLPEYQRRNRGRYVQVVRLLNDLLPDHCRFTGRLAPSGEYLFRVRGVEVPFGAMSDGFRAYAGWVADLLYHVCLGCPDGVKLTENRGIVLVDEIDLHLHPEWQRVVVPQLSRVLPRLQFVLTSHSPIVAGTMEAVNIVVMEADEAGASHPRQLGERVHGLNADQVLVSSYFGLNSTRSPDAVHALARTSRRAGRGDHAAALEFLRQLSGAANGDGATASSAPRAATPKGATRKGATRKGTTRKGATAKGATAKGATAKGATAKAATRKAVTRKTAARKRSDRRGR